MPRNFTLGRTLWLVSIATGGLAACAPSGIAPIETAQLTSAASPATSAAGSANSTISKPSVSSAEMRRFLAKQLVGNLAIGTQIIGPKREIINASILGPTQDDSWLSRPEDEHYCVSVIVKNFNAFENEKPVTALFKVHQIGNFLSAKFRSYSGDCKPGGTPFPEAVELSAQRASS